MKKYLFSSLMLFKVFLFFSQPTGNCVVLNGSSDYYEVADNSTLDPSNVVSFEAWINPCDLDGFILTKLWCSGSQNAYYLNIRNGYLVWLWDSDGSCSNQGTSYESSTPIIIANQWQHVAVVHTSTGVSLYYNGSLVVGTLLGGSYGTMINSSEPLRVGAYKNVAGSIVGHFNGRIDEVRKWNYALTQSEIISRMNTTLVGNEPGLDLYHSMDNVSGATILNSAISTGAINNSSTTYGSPFFMNATNTYPSAFSLGNDTTFCTGGIGINLTINSNGISYSWNSGATNPTLSVNSSGVYIGTSLIDGCFYSDTVIVNEITCMPDTATDTIVLSDTCAYGFIMPNVFSPNYDKINDIYKPIYFSCSELIAFTVYNRWGNKVYYSEKEIKWEGKADNEKELSDGVYYWVIEYRKLTGEVISQNGYVSLVR